MLSRASLSSPLARWTMVKAAYQQHNLASRSNPGVCQQQARCSSSESTRQQAAAGAAAAAAEAAAGPAPAQAVEAAVHPIVQQQQQQPPQTLRLSESAHPVCVAHSSALYEIPASTHCNHIPANSQSAQAGPPDVQSVAHQGASQAVGSGPSLEQGLTPEHD